MRRPPSFWLLTAALAVGCLLACEAYLRTDRLWQQPLELLLTYGNNTHTRAVWRLHQPPADPARPTVMLLGNSTALAATELPWRDTAPKTAESAAASLPPPNEPNLSAREPNTGTFGFPNTGTFGFLDLSISGGCHAEHVVLAEHAYLRGHQPTLTVVFTWPACLTDDDNDADLRSALHAHRMPLYSHWLSDATPPSSLEDRVTRAWVAHAAIGRYRYYVNAWLRSRLGRLLRGQPALRQPLRPPDRSAPWGRPWTEGGDRLATIDALPRTLALHGAGMAQLDLLVERLTASGSRVLLIEAPWSPPLRDRLAPLRADYTRSLAQLAARHGARYVDPNAALMLTDEDFNDVFHVTHAAGRRYYAALSREIAAELLPPSAPAAAAVD